SPTALLAGDWRPPPPPLASGGIVVRAGRATPVVIPPGQASVPGPAGAPEFRCFSHSMRPRSVSITKRLSELPATNPSMRKPRYPINRSSVAGGISEFNCLGSFFSFIFHKNWKPGFCILSFEIFASDLTQAERCASALSVIQSRPCALAVPAQANVLATPMMTAAASLFIEGNPPDLILKLSMDGYPTLTRQWH